MKGCYDVIIQIPGIGIFFAWQILCDVLECKILGSNTDNQWVCLGPGAKDGLRRIFSLETPKDELKYTRILRDLCSQSGGFEVLDAEFPTFLHKPLSLKNIGKKHALKKYDQFALNTSCFWEVLSQILPKMCNFNKFFVAQL